MQALNRGFYVTTVLALAGFYVAVKMLLGGNMMLFTAGVVGILTSFAYRVHHAVLHRIQVPSGALDCGKLQDRAGDDHHHRFLGRSGIHGCCRSW